MPNCAAPSPSFSARSAGPHCNSFHEILDICIYANEKPLKIRHVRSFACPSVCLSAYASSLHSSDWFEQYLEVWDNLTGSFEVMEKWKLNFPSTQIWLQNFEIKEITNFPSSWQNDKSSEDKLTVNLSQKLPKHTEASGGIKPPCTSSYSIITRKKG